jgi:sugar (pentulose or hexulose) kinase
VKKTDAGKCVVIKSTETNECVIAIDVGTQSIRVALIDCCGTILDIVKKEIEPYFSLHPGWAEQDPEYLWKILCSSCKKLIADNAYRKSAIKGIALTTQRDTMINVDKKGMPLRPAIIWLDQRKANLESWPNIATKLMLKSLGIYESALQAVRDSEANWIRQNQPEIWSQTHKFLFLSGYLSFKLTGEYIDSIGNVVGYLPFDYRKQTWANKTDMKWEMFPMDERILPTLIHPAEQLGVITKKASRETGFPQGLPVIAAAADKACEVLGSGCITPETACLSYGTTATIETTNSKYVEIIPLFPSYPSAVPGAYNTEVMIYRGFWMVNWFKREFGLQEIQKANSSQIAPEVLFDELVRDIPAGSMGLMLQPYWSPGAKKPGPEAKGSIIGFGDIHTRAHVYRAILEGIAYALKDGLIQTEKTNKVTVKSLRVSGGGSQSAVAMQITADIFNLPAERPHTIETSSLGAAIDAVVGLKIHSDFNAAIKAMTRKKDCFEPNPKNRAIYEDLYKNVYCTMYSRLKPLFYHIRKITGYPPAI